MAFFLFWIGPSGVGTLKNDTIFAAGISLIALSITKAINFNFNRSAVLLLVMGIIFINSKYTGVPVTFLSLLLLFLFNRHILQEKRKVLKFGFLSFLAILALSGHYYLHNYIEFGNPLYPFRISIFGHDLFPWSGIWWFDTSGTSILSSLQDEHLWQISFSLSGISGTKAGLLFPVILVFGTVGTIGILVYSYRLIRRRKHDAKITFLAIFILATWFVYFGMPWSANWEPGDLYYAQGLMSLRFVEGTLLLTELFLVYILWRLRIPEILILSFIGINLVSRLTILYSQFPTAIEYSMVIYPIAIATGILLLSHLRRQLPKMICIGIAGFSIFIFAPQVVEQNRDSWLPVRHNAISEIYYIPSSQIFLIKDPPTS